MSETAISNEKLMALADGELSESEAVELHALIGKDAEVAARYAVFVETRALAQVVTPGSASATRDPLVDKILMMDRQASASPNVESTDARPRLGVIVGGKPTADRPTDAAVAHRYVAPGWRLPLAASLAFAIGGITGYILAPPVADNLPPVAVLAVPGAQAAIEHALNRVASGEDVAWSDAASGRSGRILIVATHRLEDSTPCREYEVTTSGAVESKVIAASCRREGGWRTEIAAVMPAGGGGYAPASGTAAVEQYLGARGSRGPIGPQDERILINRNWLAGHQ